MLLVPTNPLRTDDLVLNLHIFLEELYKQDNFL